MKRIAYLIPVLMLTVAPLWADEAPEPAAAGLFPAAFEGAAAGAPQSVQGCEIPDFSGLTADEIKVKAAEAGLEVSQRVNQMLPACPTASSCPAFPNCASSSNCVTQVIGQCCDPGGGLRLCCLAGTIKKTTCNCTCPNPTQPCALQCIASQSMSVHCP